MTTIHNDYFGTEVTEGWEKINMDYHTEVICPKCGLKLIFTQKNCDLDEKVAKYLLSEVHEKNTYDAYSKYIPSLNIAVDIEIDNNKKCAGRKPTKVNVKLCRRSTC